MLLRIGVLAAVIAVMVLGSRRTTEATGSFCADDPIDDFIGEPVTEEGLPDLVQVCVEADGSDFTLTVEFSEPIVPPPSKGKGPPNAISGFVDFDTDQDPDTWLGGPIGNVTEFCPNPSGMGVDAYAGVYTGETIAFFNSNGVFAFPMSFTPTSFSVTFPLSELGGDTDLNFGLVFGNLQMATDCFPGEDGFVTPFEGKEAPATPTSTQPAVTPTSTQPAPTPIDSAAGPTAVDPTDTVAVTALPATGSGGPTGAGIVVLWGLAGTGTLLAGAVGVIAARLRRRIC